MGVEQSHGGPDMAPKPPALGSAPAKPWRSSIIDFFGAGNGIRTRDPQLGRLALYR